VPWFPQRVHHANRQGIVHVPTRSPRTHSRNSHTHSATFPHQCTKGKQQIAFYTIPEYENWKRNNNNGVGWNIKYYKGLGTSTAQEAREYFKALDKHKIDFQYQGPEDEAAIDKAFNKKKADERKEWLRQYEVRRRRRRRRRHHHHYWCQVHLSHSLRLAYCLAMMAMKCVRYVGTQEGTFVDHSRKKLSYSEFVDKELILFSLADCERSIPSMVDGLKPGQRKILYCCFKRNLKSDIKGSLHM